VLGSVAYPHYNVQCATAVGMSSVAPS